MRSLRFNLDDFSLLRTPRKLCVLLYGKNNPVIKSKRKRRHAIRRLKVIESRLQQEICFDARLRWMQYLKPVS